MSGRGATREVEELTGELMSLRQALSQGPGREVTKRYREELAGRALRYMQRRREQGARMAEIARELGVTENRLYRWQALSKQGAFREVVVVTTPVSVEAERSSGSSAGRSSPGHGLVLVSPRGYELRGLALEDAFELLRRL